MGENNLKAIMINVYKNKDIVKLNKILNKVYNNKKIQDEMIDILSGNEKLTYFFLENSLKIDSFLERIKSIFKNTNWYKNLKMFLEYPDKNVRIGFIKRLSSVKTPIFLEFYIKIFKDSQWKVRKAAAQNISQYDKDENSLKLLVSLLDDSDRRVVKEIIFLLSKKGDFVLQYLDKYLSIPMPRMKLNILELLEKLKSFEVLKYLVILSGDDSEEVKLKAQQGVMAFMEQMDIENNSEEISKILKLLKEGLGKTDIKNAVYIIKILLKFKKEGSKIIKEDLENRWMIKNDYLNLIRDIKIPEKIYLIIEMLESKNLEVKNNSLKLLSYYQVKAENEEEILKLIGEYIIKNIQYLSDEEKKNLSDFLRKNKLLEKIITKIRSDNSYERKVAVEIIGIVGDENIYGIMIELLKDTDYDIRKSVIKILGEEKNEKYLENFKEMLSDPEESVQLAAIEAIAKINTVAAKKIILESMDHPNRQVMEKASKIIAHESLKKYIDNFLILDEDTKKKVTKMFGKVENETEDILSNEIKSIDLKARKRVIEILKYMPNKNKFKNILKKALVDPDKTIRASVVNIIVNISDVDLLKGLLKLLNDPDKRVRANTIEAFGNLNKKAAAKLLVPFLNDKDNRIRANAIMALYRLGKEEVVDEIDKMASMPDKLMKVSSAYVIGELGLTGKQYLLNELMRNKDDLVRKNVLKASYKIKYKNGVIFYLTDKNSEIQTLAREYYEKGL